MRQAHKPQQALVSALSFQDAARILHQRLSLKCARTHAFETVERRCERGLFLRPSGRPDIATPVNAVYELRGLAAWRNVEIRTGIFLEGFAASYTYEETLEWMKTETRISCYMWSLEGNSLFIRPRGKDPICHQFNEDMVKELEAIASRMERQDIATLAVYVEILVPHIG